MAAPASKDGQAKISPVARRTLQYTLNEREYAWLYRRLLKRLPKTVSGNVPSSSAYTTSLKKVPDFNAATIRASVRLFLAVQSALKLYEFVLSKISRRNQRQSRLVPKVPFWKSAGFRLSLSASLVLFLHRLLHRFLSRLRANLLTKDATPFRKRNPRVSKVLTSRLTPAIGASLAGYALVVAPNNDFRVVIAIYVASRAAEFGYNVLEADGWFKNRPWWVGSWMLMPPVMGQLLHAFVFDRDCFPKGYGPFIMRFSSNYSHDRPEHLPSGLPWPNEDGIVEGLATMSRLRYPPFVSPILFPDAKNIMPPSLEAISPVTSSAHPAIRSMSCALLHPSEPSCLKTYAEYYIQTIPRLARFFAIIYAIFALPRYKRFIADPSKELNRLSKSVLLSTLSISGSIGTAWASVCLFQSLFSRNFLPTQRWFWGGFLSGLPAFIEREHGQSHFFYATRTSLESLWKLNAKKGYWKQGKNGDVWLAIGGLMLLNAIYDYNVDALSSGLFRRGLKIARGDPAETSSSEVEKGKSETSKR